MNILDCMKKDMKLVHGGSAYEQLSLYHVIFVFLMDQKDSMVQTGIPREDVLQLYDQAVWKAEKLTVHKKASEKLKKEIRDHKFLYRKAIEETYEREKL